MTKPANHAKKLAAQIQNAPVTDTREPHALPEDNGVTIAEKARRAIAAIARRS